MKIKLHKFKEPKCPLYNSDDELIGIIESSFELQDVKIQINRSKLKGYYCMYNNTKIKFNELGGVINYKHGFYDTFDNQIDILLGINTNEDYFKQLKLKTQ
jgi:hypothetical protein